MSKNDEQYEAMVEGIMRGMADAILEMPEEEFLLECEENGEDVAAMAEEIRRGLLCALADRPARSEQLAKVIGVRSGALSKPVRSTSSRG